MFVAFVSLLSLLAGFDLPLFKESIGSRVDQIQVCSGNSCR